MEYEFRDGRLFVLRTAEEKARIVERLKKIEGQVRGVQQMVEDSRYCLDEVQQANAIVAAMRQVEILIIEDHLNAGMDFAVKSQDINAAVKDMMAVLRAAVRR
ncbi:metal-sensitive transcriptional regulator [Rhodopila sp.]|uniref:metal-sensitive transcriptional regulator n=1 Tax=Rhodopila sp. TaxID=2480087 RepID=UPI003D0A5C4C